MFDLHKNFRPALEGEVQVFLDLVQRIYHALSQVTRSQKPNARWRERRGSRARAPMTADGLGSVTRRTGEEDGGWRAALLGGVVGGDGGATSFHLF